MQRYYEPVDIFTEEHKPIKIFELSYFLYYLKVFYSWLCDLEELEEFRVYEEKRKSEEIIRDAKILADKIQEIMHHCRRMHYRVHTGNLFRKDLYGRDVFIRKINKESPLTI